jgi:nucleotide-binding universal stress UspA family protein
MSIDVSIKTIVVATDLNGQSEAALEYARKLAGAYGARIVLAHGIDPVDYAAVGTIPSLVLKGLSEAARTALDVMAGDLLREGIPSHSEIRQGAVAQMLVDVARQYEAGLIVIGTNGIEGAGAVIVGAVAEQLVRVSPCPVLAVAADWNAGGVSPGSRRAGAAGDGAQWSHAGSGSHGAFPGKDISSHAADDARAHAVRGLRLSKSRLDHFGGVWHQGERGVSCALPG